MELVYLWVEKYKNIKNQGFNFSPRFECSYDEEKEELTINENKDYVSIFPKNINVTAIVGENGSGKSNILKYISNQEENHNQLLLLIYIKNKFYLRSHNLNLTCNKEKNYIESDEIHIFDNLIEHNLYQDSLEDFYKNFDDNLLYLLNFKNDFFNFLNVKYLFDSYRLEIDDNKFYNLSIKSKQLKLPYYTEPYYLNKIMALNILYDYIVDDYIDKHINEEIVTSFNSNNFTNDELLKLVDFIKNRKNFPIYDYFNQENLNIINNEFKLDENNYRTNLKKINIDYSENKLVEYLHDAQVIRINYLNKTTNANFLDLSNGEKAQIYLLTKIASNLKSSNKNEIIYLLDEPDLALHPNWQKSLIKNIFATCKKISSKKIHFIITSHSPFILSDLPKENIIFLEKGKQVKPFKENEQTFGANIHTLLSHGFFMEDGLMGEFAKNKISDVIELLKKEQLSEDEIKDCKHIISIIGEPILQKTLEHQLNEKLNPNETELQKLEREQKEIQEKIAKLKRENNETN